MDTFAALGVSEVVSAAYGRMRIMREQVTCDYFDYPDGKAKKMITNYFSSK